MKRGILLGIDSLGSDRQHGASQICRKAAELLLKVLLQGDSISSAEFFPLMRTILDSQPSMAPLINLCNKVMFFVERGRRGEAVEYLREVVSGGDKEILSMTKAVVSLMERARRVVIFSYSSTAVRVLTASKLSLPVLTHIGYPLGDGESSARSLVERGFKVVITSDLCLAGMLGKGDIVLTGCDAITPTFWVNRAGTYPLALAAKEKGVPLIVVTETSKFLPKSLTPWLRLKPAPEGELVVECGKCKVVHGYFERVPLTLISKVVVPEGEFDPDKVVEMTNHNAEVSVLLSRATFDTKGASL